MRHLPVVRRRPVSMGLSARRRHLSVLVLALAPMLAQAQVDSSRVYRCPDNSYTNMLSVVREKNCKPVDSANISVIAPSVPSRKQASGARATGAAPSASDAKVSPSAQSERDAEARQLLESELESQTDKLNALLKDYNNGEPERQGNERNYQTYLTRVQSMKDQITLIQSNIQALQRELQRYAK